MVSIVKRNRKLKNEDDVFTQNAWDDTEWTKEMFDEANRRLQEQMDEAKESEKKTGEIEPQVNLKWDQFYQAHGDKFFKDRKWIFSEFPEILKHINCSGECEAISSTYEACNILEIGCGVGNAVAHIIGSNYNRRLHVYCCDISTNAIETLKKREFYLKESDKITAFQADVCLDFEEKICKHIPKGSIDFITVIFTLSALKPDAMRGTIRNLVSLLKPNGMILFRDYARYDLTQLRFKGRSFLSENYYVRSDGTTSYFFTRDFVTDLFTSAGLEEVELKEDNRMLVNRSKCLKMCRCWIQAKYRLSRITGV